MSIRKRRPGFGSKHKKRVVKKSVKKVKLSKALKTMAKKYGVRVTLKRGDKRVEKPEKLLKKQILMAKKKRKEMKKKTDMKKKTRKTVRKVKRKTTKRRVKKVKFGKLEVPAGMKSVSEMRDQARFLGREPRPLLIAPLGPPQPWLLKDETPAYSGTPAYGRRRKRRTTRINYGFGSSDSLAGRRVNPSGYLSTWYGFPRTAPPSWNPLLLQGGNNFREGVNDPTLSNVGTAFGRKRRTSRKSTRKSKSKRRR